MSKAVLIAGATGKQGGAVVNALLKANANYEILALTRDASSSSAQRLLTKSPKIKLVSGNMEKPDEIFENVKKTTATPVWGVFSVQSVMAEGVEERQGKAMIDAALKNNVKMFVYSSVDRGGEASVHNPTDVPHFISKHNIEQYLMKKTANHEMEWTILRPVAFMENLVPGLVGKVFATAWDITLKPKQTLQLIGASDIGFFGAQALLKPEEYKSKSITLAGDELTYDQFKTIFKQKTGQELPTTYGFVASIILWLSKELGIMFRWFRDVGYGGDIVNLKKLHPGMNDFGTWLESESRFKKQ